MQSQHVNTRWFKYDRDDLCVNKSQFVPVIFEPPCILPARCFTHGPIYPIWKSYLATSWRLKMVTKKLILYSNLVGQ